MTDSNIQKEPMKFTLTHSETLTFTLEEYRQCYEHMRHYDNVKVSLAKFSFSFYVAIGTLLVALERYFYFEKRIESTHAYLPIFLFGVFLMGNLIMLLLVRNRQYFVKVARQVNSIRGGLLDKSLLRFENHLYTDPHSPVAYNPRSNHVLLILLIGSMNSAIMAAAAFLLCDYFCLDRQFVGLVTVFVLAIAWLWGFLAYRGILTKGN